MPAWRLSNHDPHHDRADEINENYERNQGHHLDLVPLAARLSHEVVPPLHIVIVVVAIDTRFGDGGLATLEASPLEGA